MKRRLNTEGSRYIKKWQPKLFLFEWYISVIYAEKDLDADQDGDTLATCSPDATYMKALITIYPAWFKRSKSLREHSIVHELCHCHTEELRELVRRLHKDVNVTLANTTAAHERLTQRMANIAFRGHWKGSK